MYKVTKDVNGNPLDPQDVMDAFNNGKMKLTSVFVKIGADLFDQTKVESFSIKGGMSADTLVIGGSHSMTMDLTLLNIDKTIVKQYGAVEPYLVYTAIIEDEIKNIEIPLGKYFIDSIENASIQRIKIKAKDAISSIYKLNAKPHETDTTIVGRTFPCSLKELVSSICVGTSIECANIEVFGETEFEAQDPLMMIQKIDMIQKTKMRDLLGHAATFIGSYCKINREGAVEFFDLEETDFLFDKTNYKSMTTGDIRFDLKRMDITGYNSWTKTFGDENSKETVEVTCPFFFQEVDNIESKMIAIHRKYSDVKYYGTSADILFNPFIEIGDSYQIYDHDGKLRNSYVFDYNLKYSGSLVLSIECPYTHTSTPLRNSVYDALNKLASKEELANIAFKQTQLSAADISAIRSYLESLKFSKLDIDQVIDFLTGKKDTTGDFNDDYSHPVKIEKLEDALIIGDTTVANTFFVYDDKTSNVITIDEIANGTTDASSNKTFFQKFSTIYSYFNIGARKLDSSLLDIRFPYNKYKIGNAVSYWAGKFGLDTDLVIAMIKVFSDGDPYMDVTVMPGNYRKTGLMGFREGLYSLNDTVDIIDMFGTNHGSYKIADMIGLMINIDRDNTVTLQSGVQVLKAVSMQIMFGCYFFRKSLERRRFNIIAALLDYQLGAKAMDNILEKYAEKNKLDSTINFQPVNAGTNPATGGAFLLSNKYRDAIDQELIECNLLAKSKKDSFADDDFISGLGYTSYVPVDTILQYYGRVDYRLPYAQAHELTYTTDWVTGEYARPDTVSYYENPTTYEQRIEAITTLAERIVYNSKDEHLINVAYIAGISSNVTTNYEEPKILVEGDLYGDGRVISPICFDDISFIKTCYKAAGIDDLDNVSNVKDFVNNISHSEMLIYSPLAVATAGPGSIILKSSTKITDLSNTSDWINNIYSPMLICKAYTSGGGTVSYATSNGHPSECFKTLNVEDVLTEGYGIIIRPTVLDDIKEECQELPSEGNIITNTFTRNTFFADYNGNPSYFLSGGKIKENIYKFKKYPKSPAYIVLMFKDKYIPYSEYEKLTKALHDKYSNDDSIAGLSIFIVKRPTAYESENQALEAAYANTRYVKFIRLDDKVYNKNINNEENARALYEELETQLQKEYKYTFEYTYQASDVELAINCKNGFLSLFLSPDKPVNKLTISSRSPGVVDVNKIVTSWGLFKFTTSDTPAISADAEFIFRGDDCNADKFFPEANTDYGLQIYPLHIAYSSDNRVTINMYFVRVVNYRKHRGYIAGSNGIEEELVEIMDTWLENTDKLVQSAGLTGVRTAAEFDNPAADATKWKLYDGRGYINSSSLAKLICMGHTYYNSPYNKTTTQLVRDTTVDWSFTMNAYAPQQLQYCLNRGWVLGSRAVYDNLDGTKEWRVRPGDLLYYKPSASADYVDGPMVDMYAYSIIGTNIMIYQNVRESSSLVAFLHEGHKINVLDAFDYNDEQWCRISFKNTNNILVFGDVKRDHVKEELLFDNNAAYFNDADLVAMVYDVRDFEIDVLVSDPYNKTPSLKIVTTSNKIDISDLYEEIELNDVYQQHELLAVVRIDKEW